MTALGKRLITAARHAQAIVRGEADPGTYRNYVPLDFDICAIRKRKGLSQAAFAQRYGFTADQLQDWEHGQAKPDGAQRAYLLVIDREPDAVERALAATLFLADTVRTGDPEHIAQAEGIIARARAMWRRRGDDEEATGEPL